VDTDKYRRRLQALEQEFSRKIRRQVGDALEPAERQPDPGDQTVIDELRDERFELAQTDSDILANVRAALSRIADGTFGRCLVDGGPIEEPRLEAVPWTPYCTKHQRQIEQAAGMRTPRA
jgi:DnaK suppressor protein